MFSMSRIPQRNYLSSISTSRETSIQDQFEIEFLWKISKRKSENLKVTIYSALYFFASIYLSVSLILYLFIFIYLIISPCEAKEHYIFFYLFTFIYLLITVYLSTYLSSSPSLSL